MSGEPRESLRPIEGRHRIGRGRLPLRDELLLAALPTAVVLLVLAFVEVLSNQRLLFASLASSAFLIYLDPQHGTNSVRTLVGAQIGAAVVGWVLYLAFGPGYAAAGTAMLVTIVLMITADVVHPPAVATAMSFALRAGSESNVALFAAAVLATAMLVLIQRWALWSLARASRRVSKRREPSSGTNVALWLASPDVRGHPDDHHPEHHSPPHGRRARHEPAARRLLVGHQGRGAERGRGRRADADGVRLGRRAEQPAGARLHHAVAPRRVEQRHHRGGQRRPARQHAAGGRLRGGRSAARGGRDAGASRPPLFVAPLSLAPARLDNGGSHGSPRRHARRRARDRPPHRSTVHRPVHRPVHRGNAMGRSRSSSSFAVLRHATLLTAAAALPAAELPAQARPASRDAAAAAPAVSPALYQGLRYRHVGPFRGGRVTTVTGSPAPGQERTFYFGSTGGGVWKTTDAGQSWTNVSDGFFGAASIGAMRVAPSDPNVVYVGTGSDGLRSNVSPGDGVYRSDDAGRTWRNVGLPKSGQIGAVEIHPTNPDIAFVAAIGSAFAPNRERGLYRTTDGGRTWQQVLYLSDSTGAVDVEFNPADPNELYATMWRAERKPWTIISGAREGGVYRSTDGGTTWKKLSRGLPQGLFGKADLAVSAANPNRVYALIEAPGREGGLYRSDDRGETWTHVNGQATLWTRPFYYINVDADPTNADRVFVGTEGFYVSTDGGKTFRDLDTPHGDNHDLWINPRDPKVWIQSNDGGVNVTLDDGRTWSTQYNQPTAELYQVYVDDRFPYNLYGAQQDNSTLMIPSLPTRAGRPDDWMQQWEQSAGCETGPTVPHPTDPDIVYGACKGQFSRLNRASGQEKQYWVGGQYIYGFNPKELKFRFQRVAPIEISPHDPTVIYHGSQFVHRTTDEGVTWEVISPDLTANDPRGHVASGTPITLDGTGEEYYATTYAIRESPLERGLIWVGANDGPVHVTRDGGRTWTNVTPKGLPPGGRVQTIEPSPHRAGSAYVAVLRYLLGDPQPYIYRTDDYGRTWTRLTTGSNGIPAHHPTRVVREDPAREGLLYAGTEYGMFVSFDNGRQWQSFQQNMPVTPITDMKVHRNDLVLSTQGRGFWIVDNLTPLHQLHDSVARARAHLFAPRVAHRMRHPSTLGSASQPEYPPVGATIDYYLAQPATGPVRLEILNGRGEVVRRLESSAAPARPEGPGEPSMRRPVPPAAALGQLGTTAGMHRFVWDLTIDAPGGGRRGGPIVPPGSYTARLTVGDWSATRPLEVRLDPRVAADGVTQGDLEEQFDLQRKVLAAMTDVTQLIQRVQAARRSAAQGSEQATRLATLERALVTEPVRYSTPMLRDQINYLYGLISGADQKVGRDAIQRYEELRRELDAHAAALRQITGGVAQR